MNDTFGITLIDVVFAGNIEILSENQPDRFSGYDEQRFRQVTFLQRRKAISFCNFISCISLYMSGYCNFQFSI
ncbi:MAG: hypothetical protein LBH60_07450, partial [Prevotellaceae bacterium]|nr:hypothetical protein [Prevotellaceae bacterium]